MGKESIQWSLYGWLFITCVDSSARFQGMAILTRISLAPEYDIQFQEIIPGRVLHVRIYLGRFFLTSLISIKMYGPQTPARTSSTNGLLSGPSLDATSASALREIC